MDPVHDARVSLFDNPEIMEQSQTEGPHADVEECSYWNKDKGHDVHPAAFERTGVSLRRNHGIVVEQR